MAKNLVIVESPAKAKTIEKYLGQDFQVLASVGHIRKDTKVDKKTFDVTYEIDPEHGNVIRDLLRAVKGADKVWLATDEDREGESIAWHLEEVLKLPKNTPRIVFHEITKPALETAIQNPRKVDMDMVASQQARQTLDMLVGYDLSDVVRRKVPGAISAGRVQSPAIRLIVEREREIEKFKGESSFKITAEFTEKDGGNSENAGKSHTVANSKEATDEKASKKAKNEKVLNATFDDEAPKSEEKARELLEDLTKSEFMVLNVEKTEGKRANPVPLTTAALQIEANTKLGFSARTTMSAAQGLYQAGLITYHRTDSLNLSSQAVAAMASFIEQKFGKEYVKVRKFHTRDASAQEAHEAIRPTNVSRENAGKNDFERRLYHLIWSRTLATQMANAKVDRTTVKIGCGAKSVLAKKIANSGSIEVEQRSKNTKSSAEFAPQTPVSHTFTAKGEIVIFDGFLRVYGKAKDLELPEVKVGELLTCQQILAHQVFAKPPARYTEGSLVKKLEELGIGRPSTYASIMTAIQARGYVEKGESEGEERDVIELKAADGKVNRKVVQEKSGANKGKLIPTPSGELVADFLTDHFQNIVDYQFTANIEQDLDRIAGAKLERVKMLRDFYGPFSKEVAAADDAERYNNARMLGEDPKTGLPIYAKFGKTGGFIQLGDNSGSKKKEEKPRFAPLPANRSVKEVTFEEALKQLALPALPRVLGEAPDGGDLVAAAGPFGPYLKGGKYNVPLKKGKEVLDPYTVTFEEALPLYQAKLDSIIADWGDVKIIRGAYGPYVKGPGRWNNVKVPAEMDPTKITEAEAEKMLAEKPKKTRRGSRGRGKSAGATRKRKSVAKKTTRKTTAKKTKGKTTAKKSATQK